MGDKEELVKVLLPSGENISRKCSPAHTFAQLKTYIWYYSSPLSVPVFSLHLVAFLHQMHCVQG